MKYTTLLTSPTFFEFLLKIDLVIAEQTRVGGCFFCGGVLHASNWKRAGYGIPEGCRKEVFARHSFTCGACEKRCTPNSLRFMYYRWYSTSVELVISSLHPKNDKEVQEKMIDVLGLSGATLIMFGKWWKEKFSGSTFEKRSPLAIASTSDRSAPSLILKHFENSMALALAKSILESSVRFLSYYRTDRLWRLFKARTAQNYKSTDCIFSPFFMG